MTWMMMWLNRSVATLIATLQLLDIYRLNTSVNPQIQRKVNNNKLKALLLLIYYRKCLRMPKSISL